MSSLRTFVSFWVNVPSSNSSYLSPLCIILESAHYYFSRLVISTNYYKSVKPKELSFKCNFNVKSAKCFKTNAKLIDETE